MIPVDDLCASFRPLIEASARRYRGHRQHWDDLRQAGYEALIRAAGTYEASYGVYFEHYVACKVRAAVLTEVRRLERRRGREVAHEAATDCLSGASSEHQSAMAWCEWTDQLEGLSAREHLAVYNTAWLDFTAGELAQSCGVSRETARTWRARGLAKLRLHAES
jgi:RNA polymerase sigma factor (sigma-70 family)